MSSQTIADAFAPVEAEYRSECLKHCWGHLAPKENKGYSGYFIFAIGCFGNDSRNPTVLKCDFEDLDSSPWFFDALLEFIGEYGGDENSGKVYRFDGNFRNYEFKGCVRQLNMY